MNELGASNHSSAAQEGSAGAGAGAGALTAASLPAPAATTAAAATAAAAGYGVAAPLARQPPPGVAITLTGGQSLLAETAVDQQGHTLAWRAAETVAGTLATPKAVGILRQSGLPQATLSQIWRAAKQPNRPAGNMNEAEFAKAVALVAEAGGASVFVPMGI